MHTRLLTASLALLAGMSSSYATVLYDAITGSSQTNAFQSSWFAPDGSDADQHAYDNFRIANTADLSDVYWRADTPNVQNFTVRFYNDLGNGSQPVITQLPPDETASGYLYGFSVNNYSGGVTAAGTGRWDYHFHLPHTVRFSGNTIYWVKIAAEGYMGIATAAPRDNRHITFFTGGPYFLAQSVDSAVRFEGTIVTPEPASVVPLLLGLAIIFRSKIRQ